MDQTTLKIKKMNNIFRILVVVSLAVLQACSLEKEEFNKITPDKFYKTERDAKLAIAALYHNSITKTDTWKPGLFVQNIRSVQLLADISAGDMMKCSYGPVYEYLRKHEWTQTNPYESHYSFPYYNNITNARMVASQIANMTTVPDDLKNKLVAEAHAIGGWKAAILYDLYGSVPYPSDDMLNNPTQQVYPQRPSNEEFVLIIEKLLAQKDDLMEADFGAGFGRINKSIANFVLMRLYMLEAARTGNKEFWKKAQVCAESIISSGRFELQGNYSSIFKKSNKRNREVIFAPPSDYSFNVNMWHAEALPNNYPCALNRGAGAWGGYKLLWSFYDTFDPQDQRLSGIAASYTTDAGLLINREKPFDARHGVVDGPIPVKYEPDDTQVGYFQGQDFIVYRYAEVLLAMAEILNELQATANVNAPTVNHQSNSGEILTSDGGNSALSFINAIRVRAGLSTLSGLGKSELRDAILVERSHELYCEGVRRMDLIRYQRVTGGQGAWKFDTDTNKFLFPIPVEYINEYKGNLKQNPGY